MPYSHINNIHELAQIGIPNDDMVDYSPIDPYNVVEDFFQFCQTNLTEKCEKYDIQPARIYIRKRMDVNARAGKFNGYYIIAVNFGTILNTFRLFTDNRAIFQLEELKVLHYLNKNLNVPLDYLMFQVCNQFTYYHELGHLIQKSPLANRWINEAYDLVDPSNEPFSLERHVYEFDADLHASNYVAFHILEYWKKQSENIKNTQGLNDLVAVSMSSILSYFIYLMSNYDNIYYAASTHPHPLIRISYILDNFIKVIEHNLGAENVLNAGEIIRNAFIVAELLFKNSGKEWVKGFVKQFFQNTIQILDFVNGVIIPKSKTMEDLAMHIVTK